MKFVLLCFLFLLVSCGKVGEIDPQFRDERPPAQVTEIKPLQFVMKAGHGFNDLAVAQFILPDGTRCVVTNMSNQQSLTCNFPAK